jgi:hypothetical protein
MRDLQKLFFELIILLLFNEKSIQLKLANFFSNF